MSNYNFKYYSKNLFSKSCNHGHVYGKLLSKELFDGHHIQGDTFAKAINGNRESSISIYKNFISQYEEKGSVSGCTLDWVYSVLKIIVDIDQNSLVDANGKHQDIPPNKKAQETLNALGLGGKKSGPTDMLVSFITMLLQCPAEDETTTQETRRIINDLKASNLYDDPHIRVVVDSNSSMTNIISKIRNKLLNSSK